VTAPEDPLDAAARLTETFDAMTAQMARLSRRGRRDRRLIAGLIVSIALDLLITGGLGWNTVRQDDTQNASHDAQVSACQQANVNRAQDIAVWDRFLAGLADIAPATRTPKVAAEMAVIERLIRVKDTPRDCTAQYATTK